MAQHDYTIANQTGLEFRQDLNNALSAIVTNNSGSTEPAVTYPGMVWRDTSVSPSVEKLRNDANDGWILVDKIDKDLSNITTTATSVDGTETFFMLQSSTPKKGLLSIIKDWLLSTANSWTALQTFSSGATVPISSGAGNVYSGTYTPTLTNTANLDASTAYVCHYMRVGNTIHVAGRLGLDPTTAATLTTLEMTLPIASNITVAGDVAGTFTYTGGYGQINGSTGNDKAVFSIVPPGNAAISVYFTFMYLVQ